jgi:hypothetical protein
MDLVTLLRTPSSCVNHVGGDSTLANQVLPCRVSDRVKYVSNGTACECRCAQLRLKTGLLRDSPTPSKYVMCLASSRGAPERLRQVDRTVISSAGSGHVSKQGSVRKVVPAETSRAAGERTARKETSKRQD